jgi:ankyrin repeat protein
VARLLLSLGANPNASDCGWTPLMEAARKGRRANARLLIDAGADERADFVGTAHHEAAVNGHAAIVRMLLDHGADPNARDDSGVTPLMASAYYSHRQVVRLLLARGADPRATDHEGRSVVEWAGALRSERDDDWRPGMTRLLKEKWEPWLSRRSVERRQKPALRIIWQAAGPTD